MQMPETHSIVSGAELQSIFQEQNWDELWLKLMAHTVHRFRFRYGIKESKADLKERARKVVGDVISLVFAEEKRKLYRDSYETVEDFLYSVIDSHINNSFKTKPKEITGVDPSIFENVETNSGNGQEKLVSEELRKQIMATLKELNADDDEILVFECLLDGMNKDEIRTELGISESDFQNIWRKVNRKKEKLKIKLSIYGN